MTRDEALIDVDIAFRQLEFSIKLLSYCELGLINPSDFDTDHIVDLGPERLRFPSGKFSDQASLEQAAGTSLFAGAVIELGGARTFVSGRGDRHAG
jgi:hypothetical protein